MSKQGVDQNLTNSIINNRDTKMNYRDAQYLNPDSRLYSQVKYEGRFRKRTFRTPELTSVLFDEVRLKLQEQCGNCKGQLLAPQLRKAIENYHFQSQKALGKNQNGVGLNIQALCTYCGKVIPTPELKVMVGKKL